MPKLVPQPFGKPLCGIKLGNFQCFLACVSKIGDKNDPYELVIADGKGKIKVRPEAFSNSDVRQKEMKEYRLLDSSPAHNSSQLSFDGSEASSRVCHAENSSVPNSLAEPSTPALTPRQALSPEKQRDPSPTPKLPPPPEAKTTCVSDKTAADFVRTLPPLVELHVQREASGSFAEMRNLVSVVSFRDDWAD
eukprot:TRINITY_DN19057_c0_g1_i1.p1 TRINITY_DN19057_c0_g1~~TRINITY_DN19057_c0_g1_i1.p1  ORF type:complete len:192 (-),score=29.42 TRINITY_DN19057_c0_g1_i1:174-749(-)